MRTLVLLCLFISPLSGNIIYAQQGSVAVSVKADGVPLSGATISLLHAADSSWIRSEITDDKGALTLRAVAPGKYLVMGSSVGYKTAGQAVEVKEHGQYSCSIELQKEDKALNEVAVTAKKPFIEMSMGKVTVNIEGTTTTGSSNVLDLMRRLPGVTVDGNNNISMMSKAGVLVLVDDRQTYLSGDDLAEYLKAMSADEVGQIELITQPGAKYDAAGNTGIINIKLKKNKKQGWNGSITLDYGHAKYFHREENMQISYKKKKLNLMLSANDMEAIGFADWEGHLYYKDNAGNITGQSYTQSVPKERFSNTVSRGAIDYDWTDKTSIGANVRTTYHPNVNRSNIYTTNTGTAAASDVAYNDVVNSDGFIRKDLAANGYLTHKFSKQSTLDINFDYLTNNRNANQDITSTNYDGQMQAMPDPLIQHSQQLSLIHVYSIKADESCTLQNGIKLETGLKSSWVNTDNDARFTVLQNNVWKPDTGMSNHFLYKENINAAYISADRSFGKKWEAKAGLRAEQTIASGLQYVHDSSFSKNYISVFPTAYLTYKMDSNNTFELNYGRRINRPGYRDLNPFIYYTYQNIYQVGNPGLLPEYSDNVELKHSYKNMIITTLEASRTTNVMQGFLLVNDTTRVVYNTSRNIASNGFAAATVDFNKDVVKWWSLSLSGTVFYANYSGQVNGQEKSVNWNGYSANVSSRFDLGKGWKAEIYGYYTSAGRWSLTSSFDAAGSVEFGVSKKVNKWLSAKFYADDPFYIYRITSRDETDTYLLASKNRYATQLFSLSVTCSLGSKQANTHDTKALDESSRIK